MTKNDWKTIGLVGIVAAYIILRKIKKESGVGKLRKQKRRVYEEIDRLQKDGVDFSLKWSDLPEWQKKDIYGQAKGMDYRQSPKSTKEYGEAYFNSLKRAWYAVSGTDLPYKESVVKNQYGDPVVIYRNYGSEQQQLRDAIDFCDPEYANNDIDIYWATVAYLARGGKFVWETKGNKRGLREMIFASKGKVPEERKQRISILAAAEKGGITPEQFAHKIWEGGNTSMDDKDILDAVCSALLDVTSVGQAQELCKKQYVQQHTVDDPGTDVPF